LRFALFALRLFEAYPFQPQRVGYDKHRAERHRAGSDDRVEQDAPEWIEYAGGNRNAEDIVDESPEQIPLSILCFLASVCFSGMMDKC